MFLAIFAPTRALAVPVPVLVLLQMNRITGSPTGVSGSAGDTGPALSGLLAQPESVSIDGGGNLYIADTSNNRIRRIDAATGIITTVAGNGQQGYGGDGGLAINAALNQPTGILADPHGNLYIADTGNGIVRLLNIGTGILTTVIGTPNVNPFNPNNIGDGGPAASAELDKPAALALDIAGNLYIADSGDNRVREVSQITGTISTAAGNGIAAYSGDSGLGAQASLNQPTGIGLDAASNLYIADSGNNVIRKVTSSTGDISTIAGIYGSPGYNGDGIATATELSFPTGIAADMAGQVYFSDRGNNRIRELNAAGNIVTLAGSATPGLTGDGGLASSAEVNAPGGLALDSSGDLFVADSSSNEVRMVSKGFGFPAAPIATAAPVIHSIFLGIRQSATLTAPGVAAAEIHPQQSQQGPTQPQEFAVGSVGGNGCVADGATMIAAGSTCTVPVTFVPGYPGARAGAMEFTVNGVISMSLGLYGTGLGPQTVIVPGIIQTILYDTDIYNGIPLQKPEQIAVDPAGNVYVADPTGNVVWSLKNLLGASPTIVAGGGTLPPALANGGPAVDAALNQPNSIALDAAGNLYIAETGANLVRKVNLATGIIATAAGTGTANYTGDNGAATSATLNQPAGIAANATGDLFIADTSNNVIRRVNAVSGIITTVAGTGTAGYSGDQGFATSAKLNGPESVALNSVGRLYIADTVNNVVRTVDPVTASITTIAGDGNAGFSGDQGAATSAELNQPAAVAVDAAGNIYVADTVNARVRKIYAQSGTIVTIAGSALVGDEGDSGPANAAALTAPSGVALDSLGQILISDQGNDTVRRVSPNAPTLYFGAETVGAATAPQTDFLSNIGNQSLAISQFSAPLDFPMGQDAAQCAAGNLAAGSLCDLTFAFRPSVSGPLTEDGSITDNALNAIGTQQLVPLAGNGVVNTAVATTTTVIINPTTAIYGTPVTLTANVTGGNGPVTGNVVFSINGLETSGAPLTGSGTATLTLPAAPTGTDVVTASFSAQGNYLGSGSNQATLIVTPANSQIALTASATQTRLGQNVIFTVNVASMTTGIPTGTVVFLNGSAQIGEALLNATGQAILNTQKLPAGTDTITAQYQGDPNFQPVTSIAVGVTVADDTLTMIANPTLLSIAAGKTGQTTVTLTPKNGFAGNISLSCAGLIQGATCQFSSPSVTFAAQTQTPQTVTLVINPNTIATAGFGYLSGPHSLLTRMLLLLFSLGAAFLLFRARRRSAWLGLGRALLVVFCVGLCTLSGCKNLAPTQPVSAGVTIQASMPSSGVIASAQLQVYMGQ